MNNYAYLVWTQGPETVYHLCGMEEPVHVDVLEAPFYTFVTLAIF